jgi:hypothetical protein
MVHPGCTGEAGRSHLLKSARVLPIVGLAAVLKPDLLRELGEHVAKWHLLAAEGVHDASAREGSLEIDVPRPFDDLARRATHRTASASYVPPGSVMATTCSPSIPEKSAGLQVYTGRSCATAIAAIIASYARAAVLRPVRRSDAATWPNARAA